ncbi:hypothetical protein C5F50_04960 [Nitrosopumilus ureiphilus]|uniref:Uncharacterized protein n=1 Tax=Nitrosopumilus ureiphilus TaxID=1470067 RepID=A0A7D5M4H0_9ARCH|nr:hypothetical protein C5F50_04960 [Nitrosopumilus ureiphilus]
MTIIGIIVIFIGITMWAAYDDMPYCKDWCDQKELFRIGCDKLILDHLYKHSSLFDEEFDGTYLIEEIALPAEVSQESFEKCVNFIYEKRILMG